MPFGILAGGAVGDLMAGVVVLAELLAHDARDVVGVGAVLREDEGPHLRTRQTRARRRSPRRRCSTHHDLVPAIHTRQAGDLSSPLRVLSAPSIHPVQLRVIPIITANDARPLRRWPLETLMAIVPISPRARAMAPSNSWRRISRCYAAPEARERYKMIT